MGKKQKKKEIKFDEVILSKDGEDCGKATIDEVLADPLKFRGYKLGCIYCGAESYPRPECKRKVNGKEVKVSACFASKLHAKGCLIGSRGKKNDIGNYLDSLDYLDKLEDTPIKPKGPTPGPGGDGGDGGTAITGNEDEDNGYIDDKEHIIKSVLTAFLRYTKIIEDEIFDTDVSKILINNKTISNLLKSNNGNLSGKHLIALRKCMPSDCGEKLYNPEGYYTFADTFTADRTKAIYVQVKVKEKTHRDEFLKKCSEAKTEIFLLYGDLKKDSKHPNKQIYTVLLKSSKNCQRISRSKFIKEINNNQDVTR